MSVYVPSVIVSSSFSWRKTNVHVVPIKKKMVRLEIDISGTLIREVEIELDEFRAVYKQCVRDTKYCPQLPKKALKKHANAQMIENCLRELLCLDPVPQALLEFLKIDELKYATPLIEGTSQPPEQTVDFSLPLIQMNSSDKSDVVDNFKTLPSHPTLWLQRSAFANDVVIHGVLAALGYTDL